MEGCIGEGQAVCEGHFEAGIGAVEACGFASGGVSKKRRKNGSSISGLRCPGCSLMVPLVAMLTTAGETRLTMGASDGIGAASATAAGNAAWAGENPEITAAASMAAANLRRRFMRGPSR